MLADQLDYIVGVDPHRDSHAVAVVHVQSGAVVFETNVVANSDGYAQALKLVDRHAPCRRAFAVEGTGSFGAGLTRFLAERGERVLEVGRLRRERRSGGKNDALDAVRAARSILAGQRPATPRAVVNARLCRPWWPAREGAVNAKRAGLCQQHAAAEFWIASAVGPGCCKPLQKPCTRERPQPRCAPAPGL
ncbi:MAG: transposase [Actinobacteria bacterium]|nr:transposase [Actinomycetota bacterium]